LTVEALAIGGVGHGTYAPLVFTASVAVLVPLLGLFAGPLLWAFYFLVIQICRDHGVRQLHGQLSCWPISFRASGSRLKILHLPEQTRRSYWSLELQSW
jgi:hypothetical protein